MPDWITDPRTIIAVVAATVSAIGGIGYWVGQVNSDRKSFKEFMVEVREKLDKIFWNLPGPLTGLGSPVKLTELGEKAAKRIDAYAWAGRVAPEHADRVKGKKEYQVYKVCQEYVEEVFRTGQPPELVEKSIETAYEHGTHVSQVMNLLAVVLRDELLKPEYGPRP